MSSSVHGSLLTPHGFLATWKRKHMPYTSMPVTDMGMAYRTTQPRRKIQEFSKFHETLTAELRSKLVAKDPTFVFFKL